MWCRAIIVIVALTCTLTIVQAHGPTQIKDIVCVLILNGLQKEDLDVSTLKKLQRHNVNIDDMNNEALRNECEKVTRNTSSKQNGNESVTLKTVPPDINDKQEDQKIKLSDPNLQNIIINYFNNVQKTNKPNNSEKVKSDENKPSSELPNIEHFINVWNMLRTKADVETTTKAIEFSTIPGVSKSKMRSDKNMEYINKILESFIALNKITTTSRPTTKSVDYDVIVQKIQEILANTSNNKQNLLPTQSTVYKEKLSADQVNEDVETLHNDSIQYIDDIMKLTNPFKMFGPVREKNSSNRNIHFEDNNVQYQTKRRFLVDDGGPINIERPLFKNHVNKQIKSLSEDIIREISENVRAKVLQDLQKGITTTTAKKTRSTAVYTTTKPTTVKPTAKPTTENVKNKQNTEKLDATVVLEKFMEFFQQFKANKEITEPPNKNKVTEDKNTKENNAQAQIRHLPTENVLHNKAIPINITPVITNPYNPIHLPVIHTAIVPNEPYALLSINTPMQSFPVAKPEHKITQLTIYNTKNNFHTSPITIQTNSVEVPPLGLPAQQSVVYQNIVVSTMHPFEKVRHDYHQSYSSHDRNYYDNKYKPHQQSRDRYDDSGIGRHERSREFINDEYSLEIHRRKPVMHKDHGRSHHSDRNIERFHEKLERADDWPRISRSREKNIDDDYSTQKLISRHQLPLNSAKKRSRYDDAHFRNFLKTQQKVNDMLERILATKTIANGPPSVETTV